jgi:hypothetical protein
MKLSITETTEKSKSIEKTGMGTVSIPLRSSTPRTQKQKLQKGEVKLHSASYATSSSSDADICQVGLQQPALFLLALGHLFSRLGAHGLPSAADYAGEGDGDGQHGLVACACKRV